MEDLGTYTQSIHLNVFLIWLVRLVSISPTVIAPVQPTAH